MGGLDVVRGGGGFRGVDGVGRERDVMNRVRRGMEWEEGG
jgi:hypothetical protein